MEKLYNFEVYTKNPKTKEGGWDIFFISVVAKNKDEAKKTLMKWELFDCVILFNFEVENDTSYKEGDIFYQYYDQTEQGLVSNDETIEQKFKKGA